MVFELGEFWWISKNCENGFESDDLWFQQLRLSCHFLTNWFELFWFIMLKDTRHPTYTSCPIWNPALSVYATNINHLIHENLNSIHENTTTDRKFSKIKIFDMFALSTFKWQLLNYLNGYWTLEQLNSSKMRIERFKRIIRIRMILYVHVKKVPKF